MNKSLLKFITDFGPLLIFFTFYYQNEKSLQIAIPPFIVATILSLGIIYFLEKKNTNNSFNKWYLDHFFWWINHLF